MRSQKYGRSSTGKRGAGTRRTCACYSACSIPTWSVPGPTVQHPMIQCSGASFLEGTIPRGGEQVARAFRDARTRPQQETDQENRGLGTGRRGARRRGHRHPLEGRRWRRQPLEGSGVQSVFESRRRMEDDHAHRRASVPVRGRPTS